MVDKPMSVSDENDKSAIWNSSQRIKLSDLHRVSLNVRCITLTGIFILAFVYTIYFARTLILPIVLSLLLSFLLAPVVRGMKQIKIPETVSAALLLVAFMGIIGFAFYRLSDPAREWIAKAPESIRNIEYKLRKLKKPVQR